MINKKCLQCNEEFTPNYRLSQKFCNKICQIKFWSLKNKVHLKKYKKEWFLENMNNVLNKAKEYRKRNRDKIREYKKSDRGIFINYVGKFKNSKLSFSDFNKIKERNKYCVYCNNYLIDSIDHVIPLSKGGLTTKNNLIGCCNHCNSSKLNQGFFEWIEKPYCKMREINLNSVNPILFQVLRSK